MKWKDSVNDAEGESTETPKQMEEESVRSGVHGVLFRESDDYADSIQSNHDVGLTPSSVQCKTKDRLPVYRPQSACVGHGLGRILPGTLRWINQLVSRVLLSLPLVVVIMSSRVASMVLKKNVNYRILGRKLMAFFLLN